MTRGRPDPVDFLVPVVPVAPAAPARGRTYNDKRPRGRSVRQIIPSLLLAVGLALGGCDDGAMEPGPVDPLAQFLPMLPPTGGAVGARAGRLTEQNFASERIDGAAAQARLGDYFLANDKVRFIVQQPGRAMAPVPYGGNVIDADRVDQPTGDQLGELGLLLLSGRTANFTETEVVRDGSAGGAAVLRLRGADVLNDYFNLHSIPALDGLLRPSLQAERALGLKLAVTYILAPGASELEVVYTLYNPGKEEVQTSWGTLLDAGSDVESYTPGSGYRAGEPLSILTEDVPVAEYHAQSSSRATLGIFPEQQAGRGILSLPIVGFTISFYDLVRKQDLFSEEALSLRIPPGQGTNKRLFLSLYRGGPEKVEAAVRARRQQPLVKVSGEITGTTAGENVRVGVRRLDWPGHESGQNAYTALVLDGAAGTTRFTTALPPGRYELRAESGALRLGPVVPLDVASGGPAGDPAVRLSVPEAARLQFRILDESGGLVAEATQEWVHIDLRARTPVRAPESVTLAFPEHDEGQGVELPAFEEVSGPTDVFELRPFYTSMDPLGHANHPAYVDWCDEATSRVMVRAGLDPLILEPVAEQVVFRGGVGPDERVEVQTRPVGVTATGDLVLRHRVRLDGDVRAADATTVRRLQGQDTGLLRRAFGLP